MKKPYILLISALMGAAAFDASAGYKGDLNGDGKVDLADMVYLANAIKSGTTDSACDINASGKVDDTDLHKLADIIISGVLTENEGLNVGIGGWDDDGKDYGGSVKAPARTTRSAEETTFYLKNPKAKDSDGNHSIELGIENATETPSAFLFNIELPGNLEFDDNSIVELENSMMNGHILYGTPKVKKTGEWNETNLLRFIIFSPDKTSINNATGSLGRIHYSCNETYGASNFVNCQVLNASGSEVVDVSNHSSEGTTWHEIPVTEISLDVTSLELPKNRASSLFVTIEPYDATYKDIIWSSSNELVATVENGTVTAISEGEATITATSVEYPTISASCIVTVPATLVSSITLNESSLELICDETKTLSATAYPEDATDKTVTWSSSNPSVASVENGTVTAVSAGTATITATATDGSGVTANCTVTVSAKTIPVTGITLDNTGLSLTEGDIATLTATVTPSDATDKSITWSSSDSSVASVENGKVTAVSAGTATITASCGNLTASCTVNVAAKIIYVESITLDNSVLNLTAGETATLTHTIVPENATDKSVEWTSSDTSVATVDANGNVTVLKEGTCVITVSTLDGSSLSAQCTITGVSGIDIIFSDPDAQADVYNMNGILVKRGCSRTDLKQLSSGIYILRQTSGASTVYIHRNH